MQTYPHSSLSPPKALTSAQPPALKSRKSVHFELAQSATPPSDDDKSTEDALVSSSETESATTESADEDAGRGAPLERSEPESAIRRWERKLEEAEDLLKIMKAQRAADKREDAGETDDDAGFPVSLPKSRRRAAAKGAERRMRILEGERFRAQIAADWAGCKVPDQMEEDAEYEEDGEYKEDAQYGEDAQNEEDAEYEEDTEMEENSEDEWVE